MNERIKELATRARLQPYYDAQEGHIDQFAQLIVEECVSLVKDYVDHGIPASEYATLMENYFRD